MKYLIISLNSILIFEVARKIKLFFLFGLILESLKKIIKIFLSPEDNKNEFKILLESMNIIKKSFLILLFFTIFFFEILILEFFNYDAVNAILDLQNILFFSIIFLVYAFTRTNIDKRI